MMKEEVDVGESRFEVKMTVKRDVRRKQEKKSKAAIPYNNNAYS